MAALQGIIRGKVSLESVIHSDGWRGYNGLVDLGCQKHFRVEHAIMNLPPSTHISTVLKASGHTPKHAWCDSGGSINTPSIFIWRNANLGLTTGTRISTKLSSGYSEKILSASHDPLFIWLWAEIIDFLDKVKAILIAKALPNSSGIVCVKVNNR